MEFGKPPFTIELGHTCNNNCVFCYLGNEDRGPISLEYQSTEKVFEDLKNARESGQDEVFFIGAEPTLRPDFIEILTRAKELGFKDLGMITNGRKASDPNFAKAILDAGLNRFGVSLSGGTAKTHDELTTAPGSFDETMAGIKNFARFRDPDKTGFSLHFVICRPNHTELDKIFDIAFENNVTGLTILYATMVGNRRDTVKQISMPLPELGAIVSDELLKEIDRERMPGLYISLQEFIPCSLKPEARKWFASCDSSRETIKIPFCATCPYSDKCFGVFKPYHDAFGSDGLKI